MENKNRDINKFYVGHDNFDKFVQFFDYNFKYHACVKTRITISSGEGYVNFEFEPKTIEYKENYETPKNVNFEYSIRKPVEDFNRISINDILDDVSSIVESFLGKIDKKTNLGIFISKEKLTEEECTTIKNNLNENENIHFYPELSSELLTKNEIKAYSNAIISTVLEGGDFYIYTYSDKIIDTLLKLYENIGEYKNKIKLGIFIIKHPYESENAIAHYDQYSDGILTNSVTGNTFDINTKNLSEEVD